jgi:NAD(P)-dependent dehydrogenase (short-subunit alcohol dehydrogenase family)
MGERSRNPLAGRVAVVTGGTSGIGREVARRLASLGATTVIVGRGKDRVAKTAADIAGSTRNPSVESVAVTDLALHADTEAAAQELLQRHSKIHLLVNNAGALFLQRETTSEGLERTFALNVLSPFLLTSRLAPRLIESAPARVVNVSSAAHYGTSVDFSDLQNRPPYKGYRAYGRSKLELLLLTREFARRFEGTGVTVNAVHPGFVASGFGSNNGGGAAVGLGVVKFLFAKSIRRGAVAPLFAATDPTVAGVTGQYISGRKVKPGSTASQDRLAARRLYEACVELTGATELSGREVSEGGGGVRNASMKSEG